MARPSVCRCEFQQVENEYIKPEAEFSDSCGCYPAQIERESYTFFPAGQSLLFSGQDLACGFPMGMEQEARNLQIGYLPRRRARGPGNPALCGPIIPTCGGLPKP